jgi:hypothetical protein
MAYNRKSLKNLRAKWKSGESGNPGGRPPGTGFWAMLMREMLNDTQGVNTRMIVRAQEPVAVLAPCRVCRHPMSAVIDGLLVLGVPLRALAAEYRVSRSSLHRHKCNHTPTFPAGEQARQTVEAESVFPGLLDAFRELANCWGGSRFVELAEASLDALWEAFESLLTDDPRDALLVRMASAAVRLGFIRGHIYDGSDREQAQEILKDMESWGRDE